MTQTNTLERLAEFEAALTNYRPSAASIELLANTNLVLLVGPTAAGRNTLIGMLLKTGRYHYIVSHTTRQPRRNNGIMEQNGVEYWFTSEADFLAGLHDGSYLEAAIIHRQQVSGMSMAEIEKAHATGQIAIDEIEVDGATKVHEYKPDTLFIFLLPPTFEIWMQRLRGRGDMPDEELRRRLESAQDEIAHALAENFYQFVINNEVGEAALAVDELANGRPTEEDKQQKGRLHAEQLLVDIKQYLANE